MRLTGKMTCTNSELNDFDKLLGQKFILFVYPKDNTSGCTLEALSFAENYEKFKQLGYEVIGISKDTLGTHRNFIKKHNFPFELISDVEREILENLGVVVEKKMYGKEVKGTQRSTFVFNENMECVLELRDVNPKTHVEELLLTLKNL